MKGVFSGMVLMLLLTGMLTLAFNTQPVEAGGTVGVKAGDWIKCTYTIIGWPSGTPYPEWLEVEFLSVDGTNATIRVTMRMSDGTEPNQTMTVDVAAGGGTFQGLSGFVIPANCTTGDSIYMTGYGNVTIAGETTGTYAGATRTVVYASFSQYGTQLTYYWDKLTGVMVEASVVSGGVTGTAEATETNMWQTETIYIQADGSIQPLIAPISSVDNVTYTLTDNIAGNVPADSSAIIIQRDNIILDGAGYTLQGPGGSEYPSGIALTGRNNVTIKNMGISAFFYGIFLGSSSNSRIGGNNITANGNYGIWLSDSSNSSVSGNRIAANNGSAIYLDSSNNNSVDGNNLTNNENGIQLSSSSNSNVSGNNITANHGAGILLGVSANNNSVSGNNIANNSDGISIDLSNGNSVRGNKITANNDAGIYFYFPSNDNSIRENNLTNNKRGIMLSYSFSSNDNNIYHNNFVNNTQQVDSGVSTNTWDDGYPSGGNYWSNYTGVDADNDGIGDIAHTLDTNNTDRYPLMGMFSDFNATSQLHVQTICNSSISDFQYGYSSIRFNVTGEGGTAGFCRICIPTTLMNATYRVFVNGTEVQCNLLPCSNSTHSYLYFTYSHSTEEIVILPEFTPLIILPPFMIMTLLAVVMHRKKQTR